jgi:transposase-like protein
MNACQVFCPNLECSARGQTEQGNIRIHCRKRRRYRCTTCGKCFTERTGTMFEGLRKEPDLTVKVVTLLSYGCPIQAIVQTFDLDERTVSDWQARAGKHCEKVHNDVIVQGRLDLIHVQADEIRAKACGKVVWLAMTIMVSTRLWLGGITSTTRDRSLTDKLLRLVRDCALISQPLLVCVDGLASYPKSIRRAFREKVTRPTGQRGRSHLKEWPKLAIGVVIKRTSGPGHKLVEVERKVAFGSATDVATQISRSRGGTGINTSFIERFNGTLRERLGSLTRKCRRAAHKPETLHHGMYLVGTSYNFGTHHDELRIRMSEGSGKRKRFWLLRTPAMAAGLTDHIWSMTELLNYKVKPIPHVPPKRRGRPTKKQEKVVTT